MNGLGSTAEMVLHGVAGICLALATWNTRDALHPRLPRDSDVEYWHLLGKRLPELAVQTEEGSPTRLVAEAGEEQLVVFVAPRCPACSGVYNAISRVAAATMGSVVVTADFDTLDMVASRELTGVRVYLDRDAGAAEALGIVHIPTILIVDERGVVRRALAGDVSVPQVIDAHATRTPDADGRKGS